MIRFLQRLFAGAALESNAAALGGGEQTQRSFHIENREPIPGIVQIDNAATIGAILIADAQTQEAEYLIRSSRRIESNAAALGASNLKRK